MVHDQALDQPRVGARLVHHVHRLDHVQVDIKAAKLVGLADAEHRVDDDVGEEVGELLVHLGAQRRACDLDQQIAIRRVHLECRRVDVLEYVLLGGLDALGQQPRVHAVGEVALGLLHELAHDEHRRRRAVAGDVVLRRRNACDHHGRRVLDLHLVEQRVAVLGELNVARARDKHLEGALRSEVGLEHVLQPTRRVYVHHRRHALGERLRTRVDLPCRRAR